MQIDGALGTDVANRSRSQPVVPPADRGRLSCLDPSRQNIMATHRAHAIQISTNPSLAPRRLVSFGGLTRSVPDGGEQPRIEAGLGIEGGEDRFPLAYSHAVLGPDHPTVFAGPKNTSFATSHLVPR